MTTEIWIHGSGSELQGVGRLPDGRAAFVKGALPGERVRVRVTREADRYVEAALEDVLEAVGEAARRAGSGDWVIGRGWNEDYFADVRRFPDRHDLDGAETEGCQPPDKDPHAAPEAAGQDDQQRAGAAPVLLHTRSPQKFFRRPSYHGTAPFKSFFAVRKRLDRTRPACYHICTNKNTKEAFLCRSSR